jgi:hypothetical protein
LRPVEFAIHSQFVVNGAWSTKRKEWSDVVSTTVFAAEVATGPWQ